MKKLMLITAIAGAMLTSCSSTSVPDTKSPTAGMRKARLHPAFYSSSSMEYIAQQDVCVRYIDSLYRNGDLIHTGEGVFYVCDSCKPNSDNQ